MIMNTIGNTGSKIMRWYIKALKIGEDEVQQHMAEQ